MIIKNRIPFNKEKAIVMYRKGISVRTIGKYFQIRGTSVSDILKKSNILIKGSKRYFDDNVDFFKNINTEEKAYWLGFLYADGYITKKHDNLSIGLSYLDEQHLENFRNLICPSRKVTTKYVTDGNSSKLHKVCLINVCGKQFVEHLVNKGCVNNKSLVLKFPYSCIPKRLYHHFIRGYFDGDGSVINSTKDTIAVDLTGTQNMIHSIQEVFFKQIPNYKKVKIQKHINHYTIRKTGIYAVKDVYKFLYKNATVYLDRKYKRFISLYKYGRAR